MVCHLVGYALIRFVPPIETREATLATGCIDGKMSLAVHGSVEPCLPLKLRSLYPEKSAEKCDFRCNQHMPTSKASLSFQAEFSGSNVILDEQKHLKFTIDRPCQKSLTSCYANCSEDYPLRRVLNKQVDTSAAKYSVHFWLLVAFWVFGGITAGGVATFQDAICQQILVASNSKESFGHQRLYCSVGWGSAAFLVGYMTDVFSKDKLLFDYDFAYLVLVVAWVADVIVVGYLKVLFKHIAWSIDCFVTPLYPRFRLQAVERPRPPRPGLS